MSDMVKIQKAITHFRREADARIDEMLIVMGKDLKDSLLKDYENLMGKTITERPLKIFGVEIVVREELDKLEEIAFGIILKTCLDHLDEHLEDMGVVLGKSDIDEPELMETVDVFPCDLCTHPIAAEMFNDEGIAICPWCKDKNVLPIVDIT